MRFVVTAFVILLGFISAAAWASPQNPTCAERKPRCMGCFEDWDSGIFKGSWCPQDITLDESVPDTEIRLHNLSPAQRQAVEKVLESTK